ncbi:hemolysin family protein [Geothrix sp. 21YS21S-2]|uniref:hemolysin family protein n=1 Tax=Geothrix sp. 21YS21S-2 TaxID=3068893 RepID=UPI0027BA349A|nr:hemolysin family protein [Geothrix sp. 21YS21S-2]
MHTSALIATPALILATGFFVCAEFAAVRVRSTQLEARLDADPRAAQALEVHRNLDRHLSSIQVAITLLTISLGAVGEDVFVKGFQALFGGTPWPRVGLVLGSFMGILVITLLQVVLAELLPRGVALRSAEVWALRTAGPLLFWSQAIAPVTRTLTGLTHGLERLLGVPPAVDHAPTEDEFRRMLMKSKLEISRKDLIENLFDFSKRTVKEVAVPRAQVVYFDLQRTFEENLALARSCVNTRLPLCDGDLDHVVGVIHLRDLLWALNDQGPELDFRRLARAAFMVPEMRLIQDLLLDFQKQKQHLALVVNEHGGVDGLVTLEDVLEELVGEIQDEFDREVINLRRTRGGAWLAQGNVTLEELEDHLDLHLEVEKGSVSLGGLFQERLGRILRAGDELRIQGWRIRVLEMRGMAPRKFLLKPVATGEPSDD